MTTYKIKIWLSNELRNHSFNSGYAPDRAAKIGKTYIENAFHNHTDSANVSISQTGIPVPYEGCVDYDGTMICSNWDKYWNTMWDWWKDYSTADCTDLSLARDTNLLITNGTACSQGWGQSHWAYACVGRKLLAADPDNYKKFGTDCEDKAIDAIQEEVAHSLHYNNSKPDKDGDGRESHDYGTVKYNNGDGYITPVGQVGADGAYSGVGVDYNNCNEYADKSDTDWDGDDVADGWAHWYSDCSIDHFTTNPGP